MEQMKYILYSVLNLVGMAMTYTIMKPLMQSQWIAPHQKQFSTTTDGINITKNKSMKSVAGKRLFATNCMSCHSVKKAMTGPALANVETRGPWVKRENLVNWVKNPARIIARNPYAKTLSLQYNGQVMPSFTQLTDEEINRIFDYIKEMSSIVDTTPTAMP